MNTFDSEIILFLNQFSQNSYRVDQAIILLSQNNLLKGGVFVALLWFIWFKDKSSRFQNRIYVISIIVASILAIAIGRLLALILPFRHRPLHLESLGFKIPYGVSENAFQYWSSFPSDHAILFFATSTGLLFVSKKIGIIAFLYSFIFITLPRIYLGYHYPTDILFGALLGMGIVCLVFKILNQSTMNSMIINWSSYRPAYFYTLYFIVSFEVANMFSSSRSIFIFYMKYISDYVMPWLINIALALVIFFLGRIVVKIIVSVSKKLMHRANMEEPL